MSSPPVSASALAADAWRQAFRALAAMPMLAVSTLALELGLELASQWFVGANTAGAPVTMGSGLPFVVGIMRGPLSIVILASWLIAVHRFVLLDEVADRAPWRLPTTYFRFVGWLLLLDIVLYLAGGLTAVLARFVSPLLAGIVAVGTEIAIAVVDIRLLILFPAIAVDASNTNARNAWERSRGHLWSIVGVSMLAGILAFPMMILCLVGLVWVIWMKFLSLGIFLVIAFNALLFVCFGAMAAALASRFYQLYDRPGMLQDPSSPDAGPSPVLQ